MSVDPLEEQLYKLRLLNDYPISSALPKTFNNASSSAPVPDTDKTDQHLNGVPIAAANHCTQLKEVRSKKVGPAVPPKPNKKNDFQLPEVPQSMVVKQTREPLYSKRLQSDSVKRTLPIKLKPPVAKQTVIAADAKFGTGTGASIPVLQRKQPSFSNHHIYSNNKVTLDNPAILDQQLEALEHHRKQLQKKGLLQEKNIVPRLSSASFSNDDSSGCDVGSSSTSKSISHMYSDIKATQMPEKSSGDSGESAQLWQKGNDVNVYSYVDQQQQLHKNIPAASVAGENNASTTTGACSFYSNINYENNADDLPPPPPPPTLEIATAFSLTDRLDFINPSSVNDDDDIPPPPSPVSSSYSELRRATDIYPKLPSYPMSTYATNIQEKANAGSNNTLENRGQVGKIKSSTKPQQTYMNMAFGNNEQHYVTYGRPSSQCSFGQSSLDNYGYGSSSQGSSAYESIYEPINPRPPSHLSSRLNYLSYPSYVNSPHVSEVERLAIDEGGIEGNSSLNNGPHLDGIGVNDVGSGHSQKEAEVEALTDLLVHSMDPLNDIDSFGICVACNERVIGEHSGCTAMDQVYHIACFTCSECQINLQGKPFYALDDKPYCEVDYLNTLEKCSVCMKPILERILRATGKPYHPQCFTCVVCGNSLDGIPFTVDATNQNYCIGDFHKKFAPRCCVCKMPIMPEHGQEETVRVVALDRSFHFECYKCEDCGLLLSSEAEGRGCYPLDDHVLCKSCNAKRVQMLTNRMTTEL